MLTAIGIGTEGGGGGGGGGGGRRANTHPLLEVLRYYVFFGRSPADDTNPIKVKTMAKRT